MKQVAHAIAAASLPEDQAVALSQAIDELLKAAAVRDDADVAFSGGAEIVGKGKPDGGSIAVASGHIVVVCRRPGMRRAGIRHSALEVYPLDFLTEAQQRSIGADPDFELIRVF